jgi:hypothetical protein
MLRTVSYNGVTQISSQLGTTISTNLKLSRQQISKLTEVTTGEVAAVGGSAATPAEAATASTSHSLLTSTQPQSSSSLFYIFYQFSFEIWLRFLCKEKCFMLYIISVYKKTLKM